MLREIFLKQDNLIQGCFLGELTKQVFFDLVASKYQLPRLYNVYKEMGIVTSFQNMLNNIFIPPLRLLLILIHISASCFLKAGRAGSTIVDLTTPHKDKILRPGRNLQKKLCIQQDPVAASCSRCRELWCSSLQ
ncbi:hypothetical protein HN51_062698 [Arachis hypogaea]|uniref:Uncharacterized protein n=1 Tax=Arachis hypogaea TaxID=3818 RepID=A0A445ATU4_ARAHY|nr:hypothetical protein Ahy_B01g054415 isoform A [Arachis hypogaea]RYR29845.1 hypothetical protein Ahy_B01g054415 isoform B [Arachis hypogaea]